jgi:dTMP kinase
VTARASGRFVAFEGGEGAGKSTQVALLAGRLRGRGLDVVTTHEPGGSPVGPAIRRLVLATDVPAPAPRTEALLFAAERAEHVAAVVRPALARGSVVVTDRYVDSSIAYQGAGRGLGTAEIARLSAWATDGLVPDLTVLLDIDPERGFARFAGADRLEREPREFHVRVRRAFLDLAAAQPWRYLVVDAGADEAVIAAQVAAAVDRLLAAGDLVGRASGGSA